MESKHKNALIVALVAVILVMAVGYAAFAQTLTINSSATVTDQTENWNVHYDTDKKTGAGVVDAKTGTGGTQAPSGTIGYDGTGQTATIAATLNQPGDKVVFTLTIKNDGTINAKLDDPVVTITGQGSDENDEPLIVKQGNIIFTVTRPLADAIAGGETTTMTVTAEFDNSAQSVGTTTESSISVTTMATQAAA